jgi:hypothetical protein
MTKGFLAAVPVSSFIPLYLAAQTMSPPAIEWQRSFGGTNADIACCIRQTSDGGFIVGGYSYSGASGNKISTNFGNVDYWLLRLDRNGDKLWDASFGGDGEDVLSDVQPTADGGFVLAGSSLSSTSGNKTSPGLGGRDYWLVQVDADGRKLWDRSYGTTNSETLRSVQVLRDGGFILAGHVSYASVPADWWVLRINSNGNVVWERTLGGSSLDQVPIARVMPNGDVCIGGSSTSPVSGDRTASIYAEDYWLVRLDENGNKLWDKTYGGNSNDHLFSLALTAEGGLLLGGSSQSTPDGNKTSPFFGEDLGMGDFWVVLVDGSGNKIWEKSFGGSSSEILGQVLQTPDGGFIVGGGSASPPSGNKTSPFYGGFYDGDTWMVRLDGDGNKLWEQSYGGTGTDRLESVAVTSDGGIILVNTSRSPADGTKTVPGFGSADIWIVKLVPDSLLSTPQLQASPTAAAGILSSGFRLLLEGVSNRNYVVEASTDLIIWSAIQTNRLSASSVAFLDTAATNLPSRFYRARPVP